MIKILIFPLQFWKHGEDSCHHMFRRQKQNNKSVFSKRNVSLKNHATCENIEIIVDHCNLSQITAEFCLIFRSFFWGKGVYEKMLLRFSDIFHCGTFSRLGQRLGKYFRWVMGRIESNEISFWDLMIFTCLGHSQIYEIWKT